MQLSAGRSIGQQALKHLKGSVASWADPEKLAAMWQKRRPLYEHLARTAAYFWVAEQNGRVVGFARSIERDGLLELYEYLFERGERKGHGRGPSTHQANFLKNMLLIKADNQGRQAGSISRAGSFVTLVWSEPSAFIEYISKFPSLSDTKIIFSLLGDQEGEPSFPVSLFVKFR